MSNAVSAGPPLPGDARRFALREMGIELTPTQQAAIDAVVAGRDTLLVSATGSGKSAVYQVAGALLDGVSVIVSPLIALQQDQLAGLRELGIGQAVVVNSAGRSGSRQRALERITSGAAEYVLLGPEQLATKAVRDALAGVTIDRFIIDEAHCVDAWGPDFRPDFAALGWVRSELGNPPVLALTATAAPHVRDEICAVLGMRDPEVIVGGTERRNIDLTVHTHADRAAAFEAVVHDAATTPGMGIVYAPTRKAVEAVAAAVTERGRECLPYHAGLSAGERRHTLERFRAGDDVVVSATSAFGLGVDAPHVRFVIHLDAPETVDAYYQELGRAGRDGEPAAAVLHVTVGRASRRRFAAGASVPSPELCAAIAGLDLPTSLADARRATGASRGTFVQAVRLLALHAVIDVHADTLRPGAAVLADIADDMAAEVAARAALLATRAQMMSDFVGSEACRWATITGYLDSCEVAACGHCDRCTAHQVPRTDAASQHRIDHETFGAGTVLTEDDDTLLVLFDTAGYRRLSRAVLAEEALAVIETAEPAGAA